MGVDIYIFFSYKFHSYGKRKKTNRKEQVLVSMWRNWNPQTLLAGMLNGAATVENSLEVPCNFTTHKAKGGNYPNVHTLIMNK